MATGRRSEYYENRLLPALDYIRAHLDDSLRLEQLAHHTYFSKFHFHRVFKAIHGETVHEHVRRLRLEKAHQLLVTRQSLSILDIAVATGYSSQAAFTREFKRHFRVTPGRARRYPGEENQLLEQPGVSGGELLEDSGSAGRAVTRFR